MKICFSNNKPIKPIKSPTVGIVNFSLKFIIMMLICGIVLLILPEKALNPVYAKEIASEIFHMSFRIITLASIFICIAAYFEYKSKNT